MLDPCEGHVSDEQHAAKFCVTLQICNYRILHFLRFCLFTSALRGPARTYCVRVSLRCHPSMQEQA